MVHQIDHSVVHIFNRTAFQYCANVLLQVVQAQSKVRTSLVIAIVIAQADLLTTVKTVQITLGIFALLSIVKVLGVVSEAGWKKCFQESAKTVVRSAAREIWGTSRNQIQKEVSFCQPNMFGASIFI